MTVKSSKFQLFLFFAQPTFGDNLAEVEAPLTRSLWTAVTSAALMAENKTGIGTAEAFGSAPLFRSKSIIDSIKTRLKLNPILRLNVAFRENQ